MILIIPKTATDPENYLREAMTKHLASKDAYFDFKIQLQTDASTMPVEDPTKKWDENEAPYVKVATIKIPQLEGSILYFVGLIHELTLLFLSVNNTDD